MLNPQPLPHPSLPEGENMQDIDALTTDEQPSYMQRLVPLCQVTTRGVGKHAQQSVAKYTFKTEVVQRHRGVSAWLPLEEI